MGKPTYLTPAQVEKLNQETALAPPTEDHLRDGKLKLTLEPDALVLIKVIAAH
jgi:xylan 1,4-beta-xylosidase